MSEISTKYGSISKYDTYKMGVDVASKFDEAFKAVQERDAPAVSAKGLTQKQIDAVYEKHDNLKAVAKAIESKAATATKSRTPERERER
jgi:prefoldin subunit 5